MAQLVLAIPGGVLVGLIVFALLALGGWAAGTVAGLNLSFHAGVSPLWFVGFLAVQLVGGMAASASAARFYRRQSWIAPVGASIGFAAILALPFLEGPSPMFVWVDLAMVALVPGVIVGVASHWK